MPKLYLPNDPESSKAWRFGVGMVAGLCSAGVFGLACAVYDVLHDFDPTLARLALLIVWCAIWGTSYSIHGKRR